MHYICNLNCDDLSDMLFDVQVPKPFLQAGDFGDQGQESGAQKRLAVARRLGNMQPLW